MLAEHDVGRNVLAPRLVGVEKRVARRVSRVQVRFNARHAGLHQSSRQPTRLGGYRFEFSKIEEKMLDVLVVAPHPDDAELGAGGAIVKLLGQGWKVGVLDLTSGEPTPHGTPEIRKVETAAA